jgi:multidrug efflux pump subunit AcrA (membrane-fusion protein)
MNKVTTLAAALAISLLAGCAEKPQTAASPFPPVPPLIAEVMPKPPRTQATGTLRAAQSWMAVSTFWVLTRM